jgi:hypothetical protein
VSLLNAFEPLEERVEREREKPMILNLHAPFVEGYRVVLSDFEGASVFVVFLLLCIQSNNS